MGNFTWTFDKKVLPFVPQVSHCLSLKGNLGIMQPTKLVSVFQPTYILAT